jgi:Family of unknown function (DUF5691)
MGPIAPTARMRELATSALLGSDRAGLGCEGARRLLVEASASGARVRAGWNPSSRTPISSAAPDDPRPPAPPSASATLDRLLLDSDAALIEEWAGLAIARGVRAHDAAMPALLDWSARQPTPSRVIAKLLGPGGQWLAGFQPAWARATAVDETPTDIDDRWQTSAGADRAALLAAVRRTDPARGRALIQGTWASDAADDRRRFLDALATGLGPADEPLLESALTDRAKGVRQRAADLLARLPGSELRARMLERISAMLRVERTKARMTRREKVTISLTPPADFDAAWERDGVDPSPPQGMGKRAWWLQQLVASCEPSAWCELTGLDAPGVIEALGDHEFFNDVAAGWFRAAANSPDAAWIEALTALYHARLRRGKIPRSWTNPRVLWPLVPRDRHEALALGCLGDPSLRLDERLAGLDGIGKTKARLGREDLYSGGPLWILAERLEPALVGEFETWLDAAAPKPDANNSTDSMRGRVLDRLRWRAEMHKEFQS